MIFLTFYFEIIKDLQEVGKMVHGVPSQLHAASPSSGTANNCSLIRITLQNTGYSIKFEFQMNSKSSFNVSMSQYYFWLSEIHIQLNVQYFYSQNLAILSIMSKLGN